MDDKILNGKRIADEILAEVATDTAALKGRKPCLAVILVGEDPASEIYVRRKTEACQKVGILSEKRTYATSISQEEILSEIKALNHDGTIDGILVQLPLPYHINQSVVTQAISPKKDVDGFHPLNVGKVLNGEKDALFPCTPLGILKLMERGKVLQERKEIFIIGRSNIVGKPLVALLMQSSSAKSPVISIAHRNTPNIATYTKRADLIIVAVGIPGFICADMVKPGAAVIDVGINRVADSSKKRGYRIEGDVDFAGVLPICSHITPVPGGVGPMTIAMLLKNTMKSYHR